MGETLAALEGDIQIDGKSQRVSDHTDMVNNMAGRLRPYHVLAYATGAKAAPVVGWPSKPKILFDHSANMSYVKAGTCALRMTIPVTETNLNLRSFLLVMGISMAHGATFSDI